MMEEGPTFIRISELFIKISISKNVAMSAAVQTDFLIFAVHTSIHPFCVHEVSVRALNAPPVLQSLLCAQGQLSRGAIMRAGIRPLQKQLRFKRETREISVGSLFFGLGVVFRLQSLILPSTCCRYACATVLIYTLLILTLR